MSNYPEPPPGGLGGYPNPASSMGPMYPNPVPKRGMGTGALVAIIIAVILGVMVVIVGVLAVLGVYGTRKYIANAKTAEARNALSQIARDAVISYDSEKLTGSTAGGDLCPTARPVPASLASVSAKKYLSSRSEWTDDPGWSCLKFEMTMPQYYQYHYTSSGGAFTATAKGDLDGDLVPSSFELQGRVQDGVLIVAPSILETDAEE